MSGADAIRLTADRWGAGPPVVLLHGGGQTRYSWEKTARILAAYGRTALAVDLRGHGDSDWSAGREYDIRSHVRDLLAIRDQLGERPALVGASLGGMVALVAAGEEADGGESLASCLVLVDVTPRLEPAGVARIREFMLAAPNGFDSLDAAADAVAAYRGNGSRPTSTAGLAKNLRLGEDGRYRWHWDPEILTSMPDQLALYREVAETSRRVRIPTLLVRGARSDVVSEASVRELLQLIPTAEVTEIDGAGHMVAGDNNDRFSASIVEFVQRHMDMPPSTGSTAPVM